MNNSDKKIRLPIVEALISKGNIFLLVLGTLFLLDFLSGSRAMLWVVNMLGRLWGFDPESGQAFKVITPFGVFTDRNRLSRIYDFIGMGVTYGIVLISYVYNAIITLTRPRIK
ncbi:MAG: hypothetical protein GF350_00085 [Chitinivibrionales bacterium]|nr:hypothetical protein [Chitinivibrionales bacterium]